MVTSGSSARCRARSVVRQEDGTPGAIASLKWENWLVASCMRAPNKRSVQKGKPAFQERVKFNVVIFNVVNCGRLFDASANAEINNSARPSFWHIDV